MNYYYPRVATDGYGYMRGQRHRQEEAFDGARGDEDPAITPNNKINEGDASEAIIVPGHLQQPHHMSPPLYGRSLGASDTIKAIMGRKPTRQRNRIGDLLISQKVRLFKFLRRRWPLLAHPTQRLMLRRR